MNAKYDSEDIVIALKAVLEDANLQLVPNNDGFSFFDLKERVLYDTVYHTIDKAMADIQAEAALIKKIQLTVHSDLIFTEGDINAKNEVEKQFHIDDKEYVDSTEGFRPILYWLTDEFSAVNISAPDLVKAVEALKDTFPSIFEGVAERAVRLDMLNRFACDLDISQIAKMDGIENDPCYAEKPDFCGIEGIKYLYTNDYSDPQLLYKGCNYNAYDVEEFFIGDWEEDVKNGDYDGDFASYLKSRADDVLEFIENECVPIDKTLWTSPRKYENERATDKAKRATIDMERD